MSSEEMRERLEFLFNAIRSSQGQSLNYTIPRVFLANNNIHLVSHDFSDAFQIQQPPILFEPFKDLNSYPINRDIFKDDPEGEWMHCHFDPYNPSKPLHNPSSRATQLAHYIESWTDGSDIPRKIPSTVLTLFDLRGIRPVFVPHPLYTNDERFGTASSKGWSAKLFEFEPRSNGKPYPHVLLLAEQYNTCESKSILHGELEAIITAMRNRAIQLVDDDEEEEEEKQQERNIVDEDQTTNSEKSELQFPNERKFPVLMVSTLAPSHARVLYACMHDSQLIIRQSSKLSLETFSESTLDLLASFILCKPLDGSSNRAVNMSIRKSVARWS